MQPRFLEHCRLKNEFVVSDHSDFFHRCAPLLCPRPFPDVHHIVSDSTASMTALHTRGDSRRLLESEVRTLYCHDGVGCHPQMTKKDRTSYTSRAKLWRNRCPNRQTF